MATSSLSASDLRKLRSLIGQYEAVGKTLPPTLIRDYMTGRAEAAQMAGERAAVRSLEQQRLNETVRMNDAKLALSEVTAEYDFYAKRLRLVDAAIQQANWTTEIEVDGCVSEDFPVPAKS